MHKRVASKNNILLETNKQLHCTKGMSDELEFLKRICMHKSIV